MGAYDNPQQLLTANMLRQESARKYTGQLAKTFESFVKERKLQANAAEKAIRTNQTAAQSAYDKEYLEITGMANKLGISDEAESSSMNARIKEQLVIIGTEMNNAIRQAGPDASAMQVSQIRLAAMDKMQGLKGFVDNIQAGYKEYLAAKKLPPGAEGNIDSTYNSNLYNLYESWGDDKAGSVDFIFDANGWNLSSFGENNEVNPNVGIVNSTAMINKASTDYSEGKTGKTVYFRSSVDPTSEIEGLLTDEFIAKLPDEFMITDEMSKPGKVEEKTKFKDLKPVGTTKVRTEQKSQNVSGFDTDALTTWFTTGNRTTAEGNEVFDANGKAIMEPFLRDPDLKSKMIWMYQNGKMTMDPTFTPEGKENADFHTEKLNEDYLQAVSGEMSTLLVKKGFSNSKTKEAFGDDTQANAEQSTIAPK